MAGTAVGQLAALAAAPVLSRLYSPREFGAFAIVSGLAVVLGTAMALRYELAVPLPEADEDAQALVAGGVLLCVVSTLVMTGVLWATAAPLSHVLNDSELQPWLVAVPVLASCFALFRLLNQWALRQQRYIATARRNVVQAIATVALQVGAGLRGLDSGGLVLGLGGGQLLGATAMLPGSRLRGHISVARIRRNLARYRRFPLLLAPAGVVNTGGVYLPLLLIAAIYGSGAAGFLGFTQRILALPVTLVGQAVAQVYLSELAAQRRRQVGDSVALFRIASARLGAVGIAGALVLLFAPQLWSWVFGATWEPSGQMARALGISLAAQLVASPLSQTLIVFERTGLQLGWDTTRLVTVSGAVVAAHAMGLGAVDCVWVLSVASTATYAWSWWLSRNVLHRAAAESATAPAQATS